VFVSQELAKITCYAPIDVPVIVEDSTATRFSPDQVNMPQNLLIRLWIKDARFKQLQIDLQPRILIAANDNTWPICVEKQNL
jgi:hypothetical protein